MSSSTPPAECQFCDKHGLPILPVRYAVARADMGHAPALSASFKAGVSSIGLPADTASYTLRLLRPGYLYMFDERRNEWTGYVVNEQSYLYAFDVHAKSPPKVGLKTFNDACRSKNDPYKARCITVKDAGSATKVWLGFSDVAWTADVLDKHAKPSYRQTHMQCLDMAAWRNGAAVEQMEAFDALNQVAEFAAEGAALHRETREYVKRYLPQPCRQPEDLLKTDATGKKAYALTSPLFTQLLPGAAGQPGGPGVVAAAAWAFSPQAFNLVRDEAAALAAWGAKAAKPWRAAIVGLSDPAGIAMELNGLAIQRSVEFTDEKDRKWKYETALTIQALRDAVKNGAVLEEVASRKLSAQISDAYRIAKVGYPTQEAFDAYQKKIAEAGSIDDDEKERLCEATWTEYTKYFKAGEWADYLDESKATSYEAELDDFGKKTLAPLDAAYLAWLKSDAFRDYLRHNYDPRHIGNGQAYTNLVATVIRDASGRRAVFDYLKTCFSRDPSQPDAWLVRALALNHDALIRGWMQKANEEAAASPLPWADLAERFHDEYREILGEGEAAKAQGLFDSVVRCVLQLSGPMVQALGNNLDAGLAKGAEKVFSVRWQMGILGAVARVGNPNVVLVDLRGEWSRQQAARTLAGLLAKISGGDPAAYRSGARAALDKLGRVEGEPHPYRGVMLLDKAKAAELSSFSGAARQAAAARLLTPAQFDEIMQDSVGKLGNMEVKTGVVQTILLSLMLRNAYKDMMSAKPEDVARKQVNFVAGVVAVAGGIAGTAGSLLEQTAWGAAKSALQFEFLAFKVDSRASWFTFVGKVLGVIGGVIAGVVSIIEARQMSINQMTLKRLSYAAGGISLVMAGVAAFIPIAASTGVLIGLPIAAIMLVVAWLKPNAVQDWLEQSLYFGTGGKLFDGPVSQALALEAMGGAE